MPKTTKPPIPDVEDRLHEAQQIFGLLALVVEGQCLSDGATDADKPGWYRVWEQCQQGRDAVAAVFAVLDRGSMTTNAPTVKGGAR
jgi:hypothetical protein